FMMFLMSLVSYFEMDTTFFMNNIIGGLPSGVLEVVEPFLVEIIEVKRPSVLSLSAIFMVFSASSGFNTVMKGINKAYGQKDSRNFFTRRFVSIILVIVFAIAIIFSLVMLIFNDNICRFVLVYLQDIEFLESVFSLFGYLITIGVLLFSVVVINGLALARKNKIIELLPGATFTVVFWVLISKAFNIYINKFSRYSSIYGSVASIMIMMIWLNLMCIIMLVGSEINAIFNAEDR
ncbi:YihY/virulence factor BrkB family protein, partial [Tyzzerella sp. OttesenSCG-928-J15]|nr:YihY/virulence factor BrkB family protein [Tyzzerella sp. OttesenSCG-928-J15]